MHAEGGSGEESLTKECSGGEERRRRRARATDGGRRAAAVQGGVCPCACSNDMNLYETNVTSKSQNKQRHQAPSECCEQYEALNNLRSQYEHNQCDDARLQTITALNDTNEKHCIWINETGCTMNITSILTQLEWWTSWFLIVTGDGNFIILHSLTETKHTAIAENTQHVK